MASSKLRRRRIVVVTLVALAAGVTACGASGASKTAAGHPVLGAIKPITSYDQVTLPMASFMPTRAEEETIEAAMGQAASVCARKQGVVYHPPLPEQSSIVESYTDRRYGVVNSAEVKRYGYGTAPSDSGGVDSKKKDARPLSPHEEEVIYGKSLPAGQTAGDGASGRDGGCNVAGYKELDPDDSWRAMDLFATDMAGATYDEMVADPRFLRVQGAWVACMKKRWGYEFQHRWDAGNSIASKPMPAQKLMARRDLACAQAVNYPGTLYAIDTAYQKRYIAAHAGEVQAIMTGWKAMLERAHKVLSG